MIWFQSQVDRLVASKDSEIISLKTALKIETERANAAVDRLLTREAVIPITPTEVQKRIESDPKLLEAFEKIDVIGSDVGEEPKVSVI